MYDQLVNLISDLGFPIAVSIYILIRSENKSDELVKSIQDLKKDVAAVIKRD